MPLRYAALSSTGDANGLASGSIIGGTAVDIGDNARQKVRNLSALVTVLAETNTLTMTGRWEVSNDGSTWVPVTHGSQNAAGVVLATGTAGADTAVTRCFEAPQALYGWRKARFAIVTGGTTGASADTYTISYNYRSGL